MNTAELLKSCYLCKELNVQELNSLADIVLIRTVDKGEILFLQGDRANGFYTLLSGLIRIYKASPEGKEYTLHIIRPGQMFAEAAIFSGEVYPANSLALEESVVVFFAKDRFVNLLANSPQISLKMISALSGFVRDFNQQIENLSLKEVSARLALFLLSQAEASGQNKIVLDTSKSELANSIGTISETLSRNFRKMKELGIIEIDGKSITILNFDKLKAISEGEKV
ncbi:MAG: Crp/Fnr family transcriptional regulator [candidate division Zixibacteria bacterium]|nr:Crp/Fnr family transcriptional regulator [candidate division Zixibacteria bacterium]